MTASTPIATVFGGAGFLGRYVTQRMARRGWRVRVAARRPNEAMFVQTYGDVGQVQPIQANIRDDASCRAAIAGADAVINCVGILYEDRRQSFDDVHAAGAARIARLAAESGARRLVHVSAIGADANSESAYARSKAAGEAAVLAAAAGAGATILRPSVLFGAEDDFFNRFAALARWCPALPLVGADTRFQPAYVDDVAEAAARAATGEAAPGLYELGGPEIAAFREWMQLMLGVIRRRALLIDVPPGAAQPVAWAMDLMQKLNFGLIPNHVLTRDQIKLLASDNVVAPGARGFAEIGVAPVAPEAVLESYLYPYRPYGQYEAITASARNLRA